MNASTTTVPSGRTGRPTPLSAGDGRLDPSDRFAPRHIGPDEASVEHMLGVLGLDSLDALMNAAIPDAIRAGEDLALDPPRGEHEALDARRLRQHVLDSQPAAPGLTEQVDRVETERGPYFIDLANEAVQLPESDIIRAVRLAAAELIVEHDGSRVGEFPEGLEVVVSGARSAMQHQ